MQKRTRNENGYRNTVAKDKGFSPHIGAKVAIRITRYCRFNNINRTRFVEQACAEVLDRLEKEMLDSKTKEELEQMILTNWSDT